MREKAKGRRVTWFGRNRRICRMLARAIHCRKQKKAAPFSLAATCSSAWPRSGISNSSSRMHRANGRRVRASMIKQQQQQQPELPSSCHLQLQSSHDDNNDDDDYVEDDDVSSAADDDDAAAAVAAH